MRSQLILLLLMIFSLIQCDQTPTTFDEEPFLPEGDETTFQVDIVDFEFDYLSQGFFFSIAVESPEPLNQVTASLATNNFQTDQIILNDMGLNGDILNGDGRYDGNWTLPDTLAALFDETWDIEIIVTDESMHQLQDVASMQPERPEPPVISNPMHLDTLTLLSDAMVLDTLRLTLEHPAGLDEIRDVSMMSLKPNGEYANGGQPIPLYDDGGTTVFYSFGGVDFTSGDSLANDGIYSLLLALTPTNLSGTYHWTFNSRTWLGIEAEPVLDSIVVLPASSLSKAQTSVSGWSGVFK